MSDRRESSTHRERVQGAVGRYMARQTPADHYPVNAMFTHITMAGTSIACAACSTEGRLPLPREAGYGAAVEDFAERHRLCQAASEGAKP